MYLIAVLLLTLLLPVSSMIVENYQLHGMLEWMSLAGKWFVFWAAGIRLVLAGIRQIVRPQFTAEYIFHIPGDATAPLVRELGAANLAIGLVGSACLSVPDFVLPVAIIACIFYGAAGIRHATASEKTKPMMIAMVSDLFLCLVFAAYLVWAVTRATAG
jgi:hypothetical protein